MQDRNIKILAIDDNQDNLISLKALIKESFPFADIITALNGKRGIELADAEDPDLILLDIVMPGMNGFEVCRTLKASKKLSEIPVVFVTALKDDRESRLIALEAGAEAFLAKPIDESELTAQVRAMVKIKTAHIEKRDEKERLAALVADRTRELEHELAVRKRVEVELIKAKNKAEESDRLKSTFLANMSHEIRTPMNAIVGFSQMISEPDLSVEERAEYSRIIQSRSRDLLQIINDILEISRIESGNATSVTSEVNVNNTLRKIETDTTRKLQRVNKSHITLVCETPEIPGELIFKSDPYIISQVFANLIDNAIKFTHSGTIRFGYQPLSGNCITFFVSDTGIGLSPENHTIIFEHFRQAESQEAPLYGGTGLGLSICKGLLVLLGGEIWVESGQGKGSTFFFRIPCEAEPHKQFPDIIKQVVRNSESHYNWSGKKIMLVEDEETNMQFLNIILNRTGAELVCATSGAEVRQLYDQCHSFNLVLLDIRLPDANGWDLAKEIKARCPNLPVISQTAYAMSTDHQKSEESGCDGYISKPINREQLLEMMEVHLG
jgi:signal transduction histidine kinase